MPGFVNVTKSDAPGSITLVLKEEFVPVAVCVTLSLLVHLTVLLTPNTTLTTSGEYAVVVRNLAPGTIETCVI